MLKNSEDDDVVSIGSPFHGAIQVCVLQRFEYPQEFALVGAECFAGGVPIRFVCGFGAAPIFRGVRLKRFDREIGESIDRRATPVGHVQDQFPDRMNIGNGLAESGGGGDVFEETPQRRSMPGIAVEGGAKGCEAAGDFLLAHGEQFIASAIFVAFLAAFRKACGARLR